MSHWLRIMKGVWLTAIVILPPAGTASAQTAGNVSSLITDLYGGGGITLNNGTGHQGHFTLDSQTELQNLSDLVASNIGAVTVGANVGSITFDLEQGVPVRSQDSLGPLVADRANTIGAGKIAIGLSYTNVVFKQLNGTSLRSLSLDLHHEPEPGNPTYTEDEIHLDIDLHLKQEILALSAAYGVTNNVDVQVVVPLVKSSGHARAVATVVNGPQTNNPNPFHFFTCPASFPSSCVSISPISTTKKSATGIGDVLLRAKWNATPDAGAPVKFAIVGQASLATGDEKNLLGTGSTSVYGAGIVSAQMGVFNPHLNLGYEYFFNQKNKALNDRSNIRGVVGYDVKATKNLAIANDFLFRRENDGTTFYDVAVGAKFAPIEKLPISLNFVLPVNRNSGLRPNYYFTFGIESSF